MEPVLGTEIPGLKRFATGKVRDVYDLGDTLLIVATDRISAFDVIMPNGIPDKGRVLTQMSRFWFRNLRPIVSTHYISTDDVYIVKAHRGGGGGPFLRSCGRCWPGEPCWESRRRRFRSNAWCGAIWPVRSGKSIARQAAGPDRSPCMG